MESSSVVNPQFDNILDESHSANYTMMDIPTEVNIKSLEFLEETLVGLYDANFADHTTSNGTVLEKMNAYDKDDSCMNLFDSTICTYSSDSMTSSQSSLNSTDQSAHHTQESAFHELTNNLQEIIFNCEDTASQKEEENGCVANYSVVPSLNASEIVSEKPAKPNDVNRCTGDIEGFCSTNDDEPLVEMEESRKEMNRCTADTEVSFSTNQKYLVDMEKSAPDVDISVKTFKKFTVDVPVDKNYESTTQLGEFIDDCEQSETFKKSTANVDVPIDKNCETTTKLGEFIDDSEQSENIINASTVETNESAQRLERSNQSDATSDDDEMDVSGEMTMAEAQQLDDESGVDDMEIYERYINLSISSQSEAEEHSFNKRSASTPKRRRCNTMGSINLSLGSESEAESHCSEYSFSSSKYNPQQRSKRRGKFACDVPGCNKVFSRPDRLEQHSRIHTGARPYLCLEPECGKSYTRSQHLKRHQLVAHDRDATLRAHQQMKINRCIDCNKDFTTVYSLRKHHAQFHARRKYSCDTCGQLFLKQQHLLTHQQLHNNTPSFACEYAKCNQSFPTPSKLKRHQQIHVPGRFKCIFSTSCRKAFDRHVDLRRHLTLDHPYVCSLCGVEFTQLSRYNAHKATHEDIRLTFHCTRTGCGRCYYSMRSLTHHIRDKHHGDFKDSCQKCPASLSTKQKLMQHQKVHALGYTRNYRIKGDKKREPRKDKGIGRTDYRKLLSGVFPSDNTVLIENMQKLEQKNTQQTSTQQPDNLLNVQKVHEERCTDKLYYDKPEHDEESNSKLTLKTKTSKSNVNREKDNVNGTLKVFQKSVDYVNQHRDSLCKRLDDINATKLNFGIPISSNKSTSAFSSKTAVCKGNAATVTKTNGISPSRNGNINEEANNIGRPIATGEKVGDIFISGKGAVKESKVLLTIMSEQMMSMLTGCELTESSDSQ